MKILKESTTEIEYICDCGAKNRRFIRPLGKHNVVVNLKCPFCGTSKNIQLKDTILFGEPLSFALLVEE